MSEALRLADELLDGLADEHWNQLFADAAAELRRLHAENEALKVELHEQARVNGMGGEREASLMAELERKSDAIQRLWKERDELRALNAELVEALQGMIDCCPETRGTHNPHLAMARAALAKVGESK